MTMTREIERRLRLLEAVGADTEDAYLIITLRDGSEQRILWVDAMQMQPDDVVDIQGSGELAELVKIFLMDEIQSK